MGRLKHIKEYFNNHAEKWDEEVTHDPDKLRLIIDALNIKKGSNVLDVGTGTGVMIPYLSDRVKKEGKVVAIDISEKMVAIAREKYEKLPPTIEFVVGDINKLEIEDKVDVILCYSCFPHFLDQEFTIKKLTHLLNRGGKLMIAHSQSRKKINDIHKDGERIVSDHRLPPMKHLTQMLREANLEIIKQRDDKNFFYIIGRN
ncbi:MAG: class I SAM-dependent methyltransferase [Promethearchaeia archaeon]